MPTLLFWVVWRLSTRTRFPLMHLDDLSQAIVVPLVHETDSLAACNVFLINIATVKGPTPPGTGVMLEATSAASLKFTSPQSVPSARR